MKTLLQVNTVINTGSTGKIAEEIGQKAISEGWTSYFSYGRKNRVSFSKKIRIGNYYDILLHGLQTRFLDNHAMGFSSKSATINFLRIIDEIKPDIIHLHNLHGYYINIDILFKYLAAINTPIIWTLHDCWPFTGHCTFFDLVKCYRWKEQCEKCPQKNTYPKSIFFDRSRKNFDVKKNLLHNLNIITLVPVSNWLNGLINESFMNKLNSRVIYNGVDLSVFYDKKNIKYLEYILNIKDKFIILGVANPWSPRKGLRDFINLSKKVDRNIQIILVGLTQKQQLLLPKNIIGLKKTDSQNELADLYSFADVFVNPTYEDNFPTTNLEALACGTPVITYNTGGSPESIDNKTGIVVNKGDIDGLIRAIQQIRANGKSYYTSSCVTRATLYFNKEDRYMDYLSLYDKKLEALTLYNNYEK